MQALGFLVKQHHHTLVPLFFGKVAKESEKIYDREGMQRGVATFTLDTGVCPPWLFQRMVRLGREMARVVVEEYGPDEFVRRIADPVWFQSLGTVLAFDWNASGLTTILTAALKEAIRGQEAHLGIFICGGKGKTSRKTPEEIEKWGYAIDLEENLIEDLTYSSKMAAKVDSSLVQDGYQIYHHSFFFSRSGSWTVVQQGMNTDNATARRYHWHDILGHPGVATTTIGSDEKDSTASLQNDKRKKDFVNEPHTAISSQLLQPSVLNLVSSKSDKTRALSTELAQASYQEVMKDVEILRRHSSELSRMITLKTGDEQLTLLQLEDQDFYTHPVVNEDFTKSKYLEKILQQVTYEKPKDYEALLSVKGVGPKTIRALSLVSEVIYGAKPSYEDPARYSFAHGGKDEIPYPVDRETYDQTIAMMQRVVGKMKIGLNSISC